MADGDATFFVDDAPAPRTIAFPNGDGTFIVFEVDDEDPDIAALCIAFASLPKNSGARGRVVVATGGPDDTIVVENGIEKRFAVAPLNKQSIVDRNGAGDAFAGAFLAQLLQKRPVEDCVHAAHWAARLVWHDPRAETRDWHDPRAGTPEWARSKT